MAENAAEEDFTPRNYQIKLMQIAVKENTIIFLPTGAGKTFIATMTLKLLSEPLSRSYGNGGKISIIVVDTIMLVSQHAASLQQHTSFKIGQYTGEMNLDFWPRDKWYEEYEKYQVIVMTSQILRNLSENGYIDLNKVNLLVFDECHHAVNDHPMRMIMRGFQGLHDPPRVLGLTATLLNGNCKPHAVMQEVKALETTFHGKVATVDGLKEVVGYSTNPSEVLKVFNKHQQSGVEVEVRKLIQNVTSTLGLICLNKDNPKALNLPRLDKEGQELKPLINLLNDFLIHLDMMGVFGGYIAALCYKIQVQRLMVHCDDPKTAQLFAYVIAMLTNVRNLLEYEMRDTPSSQKLLKHSSDQVRQLIDIFDEFRRTSQEEVCGIVFTKRRFTAKVVHHILADYNRHNPGFNIRSDFMVGFQNNPYNCTREGLYITKKNKQVIESFVRKEINMFCASNVLEEGVDIPRCTLVIKFDKPEDYRSYVQSKGRARHKNSFYYIMAAADVSRTYVKTLEGFKQIEDTLNQYLIGKNEDRLAPSKANIIQDLYSGDLMPPYYVDGPGSSFVNMNSAIALLCQYCQSLPSDFYTQHAPDWYLHESEDSFTKKLRVVILMPTICPFVDPIEGPWMKNKKDAKRAAALTTCIRLHKMGELDDHLLPKQQGVQEECVKFLFKHYPTVKEQGAGTKNKRRLHPIQVPQCLKGTIAPNKPLTLHLIHFKPNYKRKVTDLNVTVLSDAYASNLSFGLISVGKLPSICEFSTFTSLGCVDVQIECNYQTVTLSAQQIDEIQHFAYTVFNDVLDIFFRFLMFDKSSNAETLLLVPVNKASGTIDFDVLQKRYTVYSTTTEMSYEDKVNLEVTQESHLRKIVTPVYRNTGTYIVSEVSLNRTPLSDFPNDNFSNFVDYYRQKHNINIVNRTQPLLLVKGLARRLNLIKPRSMEQKRKRDRNYDEIMEYLIPELVVKQDFPADLWIQASFLPTVLTRLTFLLQVEELRAKIAREAQLGPLELKSPKCLQVNEHLLHFDANLKESEKECVKLSIQDIKENDGNMPSLELFNKDFSAKITEAEFPWREIDEPKDIDRDLTITLMEVLNYEKFVSTDVVETDRVKATTQKPTQLAITHYSTNYVLKPIPYLDIQFNNQGPDLRDLYEALTTAKANDIVNLERLETLGDSFLKLIVSLYVWLRFPSFNEGQATTLKGRMVSNKNLYYLAKKINLGGIMRYADLMPREQWVPPCYSSPQSLREAIANKQLSVNSLFKISIPRQEQISGNLSQDTITSIRSAEIQLETNEVEMDSCLNSACGFLKQQFIGDKYIADVMEAIIGAYFQVGGFTGAVKIVEWLGIIPQSENVLDLIGKPSPNPIINPKADNSKIEFLLTQARGIESNLGYTFKNRGYLLQALTHGSYSINRCTRSYETLEFLGDAVLDFLITCYIYEHCGYLDPGELTDLRSALVNNNTFASLAVRNNFHKCLLMMNAQLQGQIDKFAKYLESKNWEIDDEVIILLEEDDMNLAEYVDVPKILGDVFEALAGAVYLDSNKDLKTVWSVFHKIMFKEIEAFCMDVPINVIRRLYETPGLYPKFGDTALTNTKKVMVPLQYLLQGRKKIVFGFGDNKTLAKKAAAKIALRSLNL